MRGVWPDRRVGGAERLIFCEDRDLVRVPDEVRGCVCFLFARFGADWKISTAFFMGVDADFETHSFPYLVTARHCVKDPDLGLADEMHVRLNTRAGGSDRIAISPGDWWLHPTADVAVVPFVPDGDVFQLNMWGVQGCATGDWMTERAIGPGDDVFITGLLVHHPGKTRNMPIVRLGAIAGLPDEPVRLTTGDDVVALLEVRSIGGLSGSPVFVHLPFWRDTEQGNIFVAGNSKAGSGGEYRLLGVMHGFFPVGANDPDNVSAGNEDLNTGIAVVVLADRILDFINRPDLVAARAAHVETLRRSAMPKPTSTSASESDEYDAFAHLAGKLVQVPKSEIDAERAKE